MPDEPEPRREPANLIPPPSLLDMNALAASEDYSKIDISITLQKQTPQQEAADLTQKNADARQNRLIRGASFVAALVVLVLCLLVCFLPGPPKEAKEAAKDLGLLIVGGLVGTALPKAEKPD